MGISTSIVSIFSIMSIRVAPWLRREVRRGNLILLRICELIWKECYYIIELEHLLIRGLHHMQIYTI